MQNMSKSFARFFLGNGRGYAWEQSLIHFPSRPSHSRDEWQSLAAIFARGDFVEGGGFMSYDADQIEPYRRAAALVDKILKGTKPADLPVEQPTKFDLMINLKTAKTLRLTIPPIVLMRAQKVIK